MQPLPCPGAGSPAAYLRVYEPLVAFPPGERDAWQAYAVSARPRATRLVAEHRLALAGVLAVPPRPVPDADAAEAFVLEADEQTYLCPTQSRLRSWVALGQFRDGLPEDLLHAFVPPAALARAEADHAAWAAGETGSALRILTTRWTVPVPWFVPFVPGDRVADVSGEFPCLVHRVRMSGARRRVARALRAVREAVGEIDVAEELAELGAWLEEWHPRSWLELDHAGLARLAGLDDASVAEVAEALAALTEGDDERALDRYRAVVARWTAVAALERAN